MFHTGRARPAPVYGLHGDSLQGLPEGQVGVPGQDPDTRNRTFLLMGGCTYINAHKGREAQPPLANAPRGLFIYKEHALFPS